MECRAERPARLSPPREYKGPAPFRRFRVVPLLRNQKKKGTRRAGGGPTRHMSWGDLFLFLWQHPVLAIGGVVFRFAARIALYAKAGHSFISALIPFYAEWPFARIAGAPGPLVML